MLKKIVCFFTILLFSGLIFMAPLCEARPSKPGSDFVWVPKHYQPDGDFIPGHWKYTGSVIVDKTWIPGRYNDHRKWIEGRWAVTPDKPCPNAAWVPGHYGPKGKWIPGHWK